MRLVVSRKAVKFGLWAGVITWMLLFIAYGVAFVTVAIKWLRVYVVPHWYGEFLAWFLPVFVFFLDLLICIAMARFVVKFFKKV